MKKIIAWIVLIACFSLSLVLMFIGVYDTFSEFIEAFLVISMGCYVCFGLTALSIWCIKIVTTDGNKVN